MHQAESGSSTRATRSWIVLAVVFALVAAACSGGLDVDESSATQTSALPDTTVPGPSGPPATTIAPAEIPTFANDDDELIIDPEVRRGTLDNGLQYYVRNNDNPGERATLRIAIDAGSIMEDEDQLGGAHFLEHMLFNGTESYPANDLITVLESFGSAFGADINAYTSFGETVYTLQIPIDDPNIIDTAFNVLYEWSSLATIDPDQVDLEAGVVVEEWRRRTDFWSRYRSEVLDRLLGGTAYENRMPIGNEQSILDMAPAAIRRFYEDWYRPDLMAVVVVGEIDVDDMEDRIISRFSELDNPVDAPERETVAITPASEPTFVRLADPENSDTFVELNYPLPAAPYTTVGPLRQDLAHEVALLMLSNRLSEDVQRGGTPFFDASGASNALAREQQTGGLFAYTDPENAANTLESLLVEVERARRDGFDQAELERAVIEFRSSVQQTYDQRESKQDSAYADDYVAHFLTQSPIQPAADHRDLYFSLLDEMTVEQVDATFQARIDSTEPLVIIAGPQTADSQLPSEDEMRATLDRVRASDVAPREFDNTVIESLLEPPEAVVVANRRELRDITFDGTPARILAFDNGVRVAMVQTQIVTNEVSLQATSPGGWAIEDPDDTVEAQLVPRIVADSGVAEFDKVTLDRFLADKTVAVAPFIDESEEGFNATVASTDLEVLFQLIHLYMTQPKADDAAVTTLINGTRPLATDLTQDPDTAATQELFALRYDGNPQYFAYPPLDELDSLDIEAGLEIYKRHFGDASDFVFAFAGDFDSNELEILATQYLGNLPSDGEPDESVNIQPPPPADIRRATVEAGDAQAQITYLFSEPIDFTERNQMTSRFLQIIVSSRLRERIREELSASYSPFAVTQISTKPTTLADTFMQISGDPGRLSEIDAAVRTDLADLQENGPSAAQFAAAAESLRRELELVNNPLYIEQLAYYATNPDENAGQFGTRPILATQITARDVQSLAQSILPLDRYVEVQLVPAS